MATETRASAVRTTAAVHFILGLWLFISPWVYHATYNPDSWNSWLLGALIALIAGYELTRAVMQRSVNWMMAAFGVWIFLSPWIFSYTLNTGRFINSLCVGALIFFMALYGAAGRAPAGAEPRRL